MLSSLISNRIIKIHLLSRGYIDEPGGVSGLGRAIKSSLKFPSSLASASSSEKWKCEKNFRQLCVPSILLLRSFLRQLSFLFEKISPSINLERFFTIFPSNDSGVFVYFLCDFTFEFHLLGLLWAHLGIVGMEIQVAGSGQEVLKSGDLII